jgi:hypothetical protein
MPSIDLVAIGIATNAGKKTAEVKERNAIAMAHLTMAFEIESLFGMIFKSMSNNWPAGLTHRVVV